MEPAEEIVPLVDEQNNVTGTAPRARVRAERLRHRATYIFVFAHDGRLYLQRRTDTKDMFPGCWDAAAGGVLVVGESYEESARREAAEELGIEGVELTPRFDFYHEDADNRIWGRVYTCVYEGPFRWQPEEVVEGLFVEVEDVLAGRYEPLTPDTLAALRALLERWTPPGTKPA